MGRNFGTGNVPSSTAGNDDKSYETGVIFVNKPYLFWKIIDKKN
jgi:hypothetical protein